MTATAALNLLARPLAAVLVAALVLAGCASSEPGPRLREIERFSEMSDADIDKAKADCYAIATTDYNCADLIPPTHGMDVREWKELNAKTKICRQNQTTSFNACLRGKGVRYAEFN